MVSICSLRVLVVPVSVQRTARVKPGTLIKAIAVFARLGSLEQSAVKVIQSKDVLFPY